MLASLMMCSHVATAFRGALGGIFSIIRDAAIDASLISLLNFFFEPVRDAPVVHVPSDGAHNYNWICPTLVIYKVLNYVNHGQRL